MPTSCRIDLTIEIRNGDGSKLKKPTTEAPNIVGFLNGLAYTLFKSVQIKLGNEIVSNSYPNYHLGSYLTLLTSFDDDSRGSRLPIGGFYTDNDPSDVTSKTFGFHKRMLHTNESQRYRVQGNIIDSIFLQERFILPFLNLGLKFDLNSPEIVLQTNQQGKPFKYKLIDMKFRTRHVKLASSIKLQIERSLSTKSAKYHFRSPLVRCWSIPKVCEYTVAIVRDSN